MMSFFNGIYLRFISSLSVLKGRKGQTLVEYALLLVLIAIVVILAATLVGTKTCTMYSKVAGSLPS